ncbi:NUDIX hydrolase [Streptomyces sparsogenes DSM 40356]|uniref:NUDIX hydrolase n=1 Tax=Streptomyces sparsogenes DSM 40356 TaxID=1331668 RepID=A0A1R1S5E2_9ACTN|nr:NUDIX hydrolase [Streptomyces sparsogenes DSM 40356]
MPSRARHSKRSPSASPPALRPVHVMHHHNPEGRPRVGCWFFATAEWEGEPVNAEPHKCAGISWHPMNAAAGDARRPHSEGPRLGDGDHILRRGRQLPVRGSPVRHVALVTTTRRMRGLLYPLTRAIMRGGGSFLSPVRVEVLLIDIRSCHQPFYA